MAKLLIITLTGPDRIGFVESVTKLVLKHGANVDQSRMARLGGEFAVLMLISVEAQAFQALRDEVTRLQNEGYQVTTRETEMGHSPEYSGWLPYTIEINGADHEGIIHHITRYLAEKGINIETLTTGMVPAPMSGTPLFTMSAVVVAPPSLTLNELRNELAAVGDRLNVDTDVAPYIG